MRIYNSLVLSVEFYCSQTRTQIKCSHFCPVQCPDGITTGPKWCVHQNSRWNGKCGAFLSRNSFTLQQQLTTNSFYKSNKPNSANKQRTIKEQNKQNDKKPICCSEPSIMTKGSCGINMPLYLLFLQAILKHRSLLTGAAQCNV